MIKHLLFLLLFLSTTLGVFAQTLPTCPSNDTPGADNCIDACIYCNLELFVGSTEGYTPSGVAGFCGTIESEQWLGFVAGANTATITVVPANCQLGNGVQVAVFDDCLSTPIGCNGGISNGGNLPVSVTVSLTPGEVYYLMVDSWAGDICDFTVTVSPPGAAIGTEFEPEKINLCPSETFTYEGVTYSAPAIIRDTFPSNNGGCDTIKTIELVLVPNVAVSKTLSFCPYESVVIDGITFTQPGTYVSPNLVPSTTGGCDSLVTYTLVHLPQPVKYDTLLLQTGQALVIGGVSYFAPGTAQEYLPAGTGCDTLVNYLLLLDPTVPDTCSESESFVKYLGTDPDSERGNVIFPAADGNLYIAGEQGTNSLLMKVTPGGAVLWSRSFQPVPQATAHITDLVEDSDGMLAGSAIVGDGNFNLKSYAFRYDPGTGNILWAKRLEQQSPEAFAILEKEPGGNYLMLTSPQLALNVDDAEVWEFNRNTGALVGGLTDRYGLGVSDVWNSMVVHNNALYVVGRHIPVTQPGPAPLNKMRAGLSKIDLVSGNPVWTRLSHIDTSASATLFGQDLLVHDNALLSVYNGNDSADPDGVQALFLQKNTLDGELLWVKRFDTPILAGLLASDLQLVSDGYVIVGLAIVNGVWDKVVLKTGFDGNLLWSSRIANTSLANTANVFSLGQHQSAVVNDVLYLTGGTADAAPDVLYVKMKSDGELSDPCGLIEPFSITSTAVSNPVSTSLQLTFNQFIGQSANNVVATATEDIPVLTYCVSCVRDCDDTLDLGPDIILCFDSTLTFDAGSGFASYLWQDGSTASTFTTDAAGVYWVEVTDECGDKQRDSVLLTFSLVSDIKLSDATLCFGESLTVSVPGFDTYDWSPATGLSCDNCATVTVQPTVTTTYSLFAENQEGCTKTDTFTVTVLPLETRFEALAFCPGKSVTIGGTQYTQSGTVVDTIPGTAGCDTIVTYSLTVLPYNTGAQTIQFCPGESVSIGGNSYTQSGTVIDTIAGTAGCDTIVTYTLVKLPQPVRSETIEFCSGETVSIGGNSYTQPGTVVDTIPASAGCDTIVTYTLKFIDTPNSSVSLDCPSDIDVAVDPGAGPVVVNYNQPAVSSDCECPGIALNLTQGLPSGSLFPIGLTNVCYQAKDSCGNTATCCFEVFVREESACDIKTIGCLKWELLDITRDAENDLTYRIRVTNSCANKLIYTAIQVPDGLVAVSPANNSVFTAPSGRLYDVRNPNYSPFYSIRFKSQADSIANGQSDIFKYKLPGQTMPAYIHVNARLAPQLFFEAHLNTFYCPIGVTPDDDRPADKREGPANLTTLRVFPNPTSGALYADFSEWQGEQLQIRVFSSQGQRVQMLTMQAEDIPQQIGLPEGLSAGLYFLEVLRPDGERHTVRFVVQN